MAARVTELVRHVDRHQLPGVGVEQQRRQVGGELRVVPDAVGERLDDPMDLVEQDGGVGGAQPAVARRGAGDERVDVRREVRDPGGGRGHVLVDVLVRDLDGGLALVRLGAGEQLVEHDTGGVDVGAGVGAAVHDQLRGEVGDGPDQDASGRRVLGVGADRLGEAEVGHLDPAVVGDQHVLGLDVTVDEARPVGGGQCGQHGLEERERPGGRHRALLADHVAQRVPGDQLHGEVDGAVLLALVVDRHHVRVREPGGGPGLADEPGRELLVVAHPRVHDLDRDRAVQADVGGLVDAGHAAAGDARADAVPPVEEPPGQGVTGGRGGALVGVPV